MSNSIYHINKGVGKAVEFRGLKAQYIWYLGIGIAALLLLFAFLYICGVNIVFCLSLVAILGTALFFYVYHLSHRYGEHGMMKKMAKQSVPKIIKCYSRIQ